MCLTWSLKDPKEPTTCSTISQNPPSTRRHGWHALRKATTVVGFATGAMFKTASHVRLKHQPHHLLGPYLYGEGKTQEPATRFSKSFQANFRGTISSIVASGPFVSNPISTVCYLTSLSVPHLRLQLSVSILPRPYTVAQRREPTVACLYFPQALQSLFLPRFILQPLPQSCPTSRSRPRLPAATPSFPH